MVQFLKYWRLVAILIVIVLCSKCVNASGTTFYISQSGGAFSGGSACNGQTAESIATFNAGSESAGNTYYWCGAITTPPVINGSGTSGNVISFIWDTGARITVPYGQIINLHNGNNAYLLFDGGIPCGPGTPCDTVEAANQTGYATGQAGIIEATANGSALANQNTQTQAFWGCTNGCHDIEIRNLIIRNLYRHTLTTDATGNIDGGNYTIEGVPFGPGIISIHDSTIHDGGNQINIATTTGGTTLNVYNNDMYHNNWAIAPTGTGTRTVNIYSNHFHDASNWDTSGDSFHHNGIHVFMNNASDSLGLNIYNNMSDGNWGSCCTTSTQLFVDTGGFSTPDNVNAYNNISVQYAGNLAPAWIYAATTGIFVNNTALGVATTPSNTYAVALAGTNITFKNNVIQNYGQYLYVASGTSFAAFDYNTYGPIGLSGVNHWQYGTTGTSTFSAWPGICSCDSHGQYNTNLNLSSAGAPQSTSSILIGAGTNLTSLGITALDSDTSDGDTRTPIGRPTAGAWTAGAYQSLAPNPPGGLTATPAPISN
jgi:hypothetical protein